MLAVDLTIVQLFPAVKLVLTNRLGTIEAEGDTLGQAFHSLADQITVREGGKVASATD